MIVAFAYGFRLEQADFETLGEVLMTLGLSLWPLFIITVIVLNLTHHRHDPHRKRQWFRALFLPFLGAVASVIVVGLFMG